MSCPTTTEVDIPALLAQLTTGLNFSIPNIDLNDPLFNVPVGLDSPLYQAVTRLQISEVTDGTITGPGAFDRFMAGMKAHLTEEYEKGRITGTEYSKVYIAMTELAMTNAVQFLLGRDTAFWEAQQAQIGAINARAVVAKTKLEVAIAKIGAKTAEVQLAIATLQSTKLSEETVNIRAQTSLTCAQKHNIDAQTLNEPKKGRLLDEQFESTRAQTADNRLDGSIVAGAIGKQKDLYTQQITAYQRKSEVDAARIFSDAWITQKTIDEGLTAPTGFTNASLDQVLLALKLNNGLGGSVGGGGGGGGTPPPIA